LVAELHALGPELGQGAVDVRHFEADVKEPGALLGDPSRHAGLRPLSLQELDVGLSDRQHGQARLADLLLVLEREAERVPQEVDGLRERVHGDGDGLDALDLPDALLWPAVSWPGAGVARAFWVASLSMAPSAVITTP